MSQQPSRDSQVRSFLIADVRGYSDYTSLHGDEAASRLAADLATIAGEAASAWGGSLVEVRGDEALLAFASARQALRAAVELQSAFADEQAAGSGSPLSVGIGLDAGEAVSTGGGYRGAALNLAARLCAVSGPGEIHASDAVVHLAGAMDELRFVATEPLQLKGFDGPLTAYSVTAGANGSVPVRPRASTSAMDPASLAALETIVPLAGRQQECRWLGWHWRRARAGHGRTVAISGPPGIGKTRLCAELASWAQRDGAAIVYVPAGAGIESVDAIPDEAGLVILDDLDAARPTDLARARELAAAVADTGTLLVIAHRTAASTTLREAVEAITGELTRRELGPLDIDAVRAIAALYAGEAVDRLPLAELLEETKGHPASIHHLAHVWSRRLLIDDVHTAARQTASGRDDLRQAEARLTDQLAALDHGPEHAARFARAEDAPVAQSPEEGVVCPYRGLSPYGTADAAYFCGRERLVAELVTRLVGSTFVGVLGASGSGKSSAIMAGLLPALAAGVLPGSEGWVCLTMRPGRDAMAALDHALRGAVPAVKAERTSERLDAALASLALDQRLLLVIDQFEELFGDEQPGASVEAFLDLVTSGQPHLGVIAAMRADYLDRVTAHRSLSVAMTRDQVLVGPMTRDELQAVIELPARRAHLHVEPALITAMVDDARDRRAILPLLSTTLLELWRQRAQDTLTLAAYEASGGLDGAIARMAEATWASLDEPAQVAARTILLRLAGPGEGDEVVRRTATLEEFDLEGAEVASRAFEALVRARLLVVDDGLVEVVHEALFREWPRLRGWLEADAVGRQVQVHLMSAARQWDEAQRDAGDLYRGARLASALEWAAEHDAELNAVERAFLAQGQAVSEREIQRQRRTNRRLRLLLTGTLAFLAVAVLAGVSAFVAARQADEQRLSAEQSALVSSAVAVMDDDPGLAKVLLVSAADEVPPSAELLAAMQAADLADPVVRRLALDRDPEGSHYRLPFVDARPDGAVLAVSEMHDAPGTSVEFLDATTGDLIRPPIVTPPGTITSQARYTPDGTRVVMGIRQGRSVDVEVQRPGVGGSQRSPESQGEPGDAVGEEQLGLVVLSASDGREVSRLPLGRCGVLLADVSDEHALAVEILDEPDAHAVGNTDDALDAGDLLDDPANEACDWSRGPWALVLVSLSDGSRRTLTSAPFVTAWSPGLSRDDRFVAFDDAESESTSVYRIDPWSPVFEHDLLGVRSISDNGALLLTGPGEPDQPLEIWDVAAGERLSRYAGLDFVTLAEFEPDSALVATTGNDGRLHRWDAYTGEAIQVVGGAGDLRPFPAGPGMIGVPVATTSEVTTVAVNPRGSIAGSSVSCERSDASGLWLNPNAVTAAGTDLVVDIICGPDGIGETVVVDPLSGEVRHRWEAGADNQRSISGDGRYLARQEAPAPRVWGDIVIHDLGSGEIVRRMSGLREWSPTPSGDLPDCPEPPADAGEADGEGLGIRVSAIEWSPDGRHLAVLDDVCGSILVWDARTGELEWLASARGQDPTSFYTDLSFDADGTRLYLSRAVEGAEAEENSGTLDVLDVHDAATGELLQSTTPYTDHPANMAIVGTSSDGRELLALPGGRNDGLGVDLIWIDAERLDAVGPSLDDIHASPVRSWALSPDRTLLATGSTTGQVRIWDVQRRRRVAELDISTGDSNRSARGLAWLGDSELAVASEAGEIFVTTIDPDELTAATRASITRAPTADQCARFGLEPCPTLAELRDGSGQSA